MQLFLLRNNKFFPFHYSDRSCENRPVWGAKTFQPFGNKAEGLFCFLNFFTKKEGFLRFM